MLAMNQDPDNAYYQNISLLLSNETNFIILRQKLKKLLAFQIRDISVGHPVYTNIENY